MSSDRCESKEVACSTTDELMVLISCDIIKGSTCSSGYYQAIALAELKSVQSTPRLRINVIRVRLIRVHSRALTLGKVLTIILFQRWTV